MSQPRPGKRQRAGIEGSTIVVPNRPNSNKSSTKGRQDNDTSALLRMLAGGCQKHENQHKKEKTIEEPTQAGDAVPPSCTKALHSLGTIIIPKVEKAYCAAASPKGGDVKNLCDFYQSVVHCTFCPSAHKLFEYGQKPGEVTSRVILILEHIVSPHHGGIFKTQWKRSHNDSLFDKLCETAAKLLTIINDPELQKSIFTDLVSTIYDLSVLEDHFETTDESVEILLFSDTLRQTTTDSEPVAAAKATDSQTKSKAIEKALRVDSLEASILLQAALLQTLRRWVCMRPAKQLECFPDHSRSRGAELLPDAGLAHFLWPHGQIDVTSETCTDFYSIVVDAVSIPTSADRLDFRHGLVLEAGFQIIHALLLEFKSFGVPNPNWLFDLSSLVVRTAHDILRLEYEDPRFVSVIAKCIEQAIVDPPRINGWTHRTSQLDSRRVTCPILLDCVPLISSTSTTKDLGFAILHALRKTFDGGASSSLLPSDYPRLLDSDIWHALFGLLEVHKLAEHSVWLCALIIDRAQETFGSLDRHRLAQMIHETHRLQSSHESINEESELGRKRRGFGVDLLNSGSPSKRQRIETELGKSATQWIKVLEEYIVHTFALALSISDNIEGIMDDLVTTKRALLVSNAVELFFFSQTFDTNDVFKDVIGQSIAYLNCWVGGVFVRNSLIDESTRDHSLDIAASLSTCLRSTSQLRVYSDAETLLDNTETYVSMNLDFIDQGIRKSGRFPLVPLDTDKRSQLSRIRLLSSLFKSKYTHDPLSGDIMDSTLDLLRSAPIEHAEPVARLLLWQVAAWLIQSSTEIERHLLLAGDNQDLGASKWLKYLVSTPFSDDNERIRTYTAGEIGRLIILNPVIRGVVMGTANKNRVQNFSKHGLCINPTEQIEETRLFKDIDSLLHRYCQIPQSQLSFTVGLSMGSDDDDWRTRVSGRVAFHRSGILALGSLFGHFFNLRDVGGDLIAKDSFLRVVRFLVFFAQNRIDEASSFTFGVLSSVLYKANTGHHKPFLFQVAPATFRDVLFPSSIYFTATDRGNKNPLVDQLEQACRLLYALVEKIFVIGDFNDFTLFGGVTTNDINESLNTYLPNVLCQLIIEKDYEVLRSLTAFSRYVMSRRHEFRKGRRATVSFEEDFKPGFSSRSHAWARNLEEQTKELCSVPDIIERLLPLLLMHAGPDEDRFFTKRVLQNKLSLPKVLHRHGQLVLRGLITELGESDEAPKEVIWALKRAAIARDLSDKDHRSGTNSASVPMDSDLSNDSVHSWISENFMHLLVNLVQSRWREKTLLDKIRSLRCLRSMLAFLKPTGSAQFFPHIMSTVNASIGDSEMESLPESYEIRYLTVQIIDTLVRRVWDDNWEIVGENLTSIVVALIPSLSVTDGIDRLISEATMHERAVSKSVNLLKWLTEGARGKCLAVFFRKIPFLPPTPALDPVRASLSEIGLDFDDLRLTMTEASLSRVSTQSDVASIGGDSRSTERRLRIKNHLQNRISTVSSLLSNENSSIRLNALRHLISLLEASRTYFDMLLDTEETSCLARFLTVSSSKSYSPTRGVLGDLVGTLLNRCIVETNKQARVLLAQTLGEIGAIADRNISHGPNDILNKESDKTYLWRLSRPPWKVNSLQYEVLLLTDHLIAALRAATTSLDHQKIAFTIQEVLAVARLSVPDTIGQNRDFEVNTDGSSCASGMPVWLKDELTKSGVLQIVEPFLNSEFCEKETSVPGAPPFFSESRSYFEWISCWCRYMIHRSKQRGDNQWCKLLHACRLAFRTQSGLSIAEFLLPIVVLDRICFGDLQDEECILKEILNVLDFDSTHEIACLMPPSERQKSVSTVFSIIETLRYWSEKDTEDRHRSPRKLGNEESRKPGEWTSDESIMRIDDILDRVPLGLQAKAAAESGMHARSLLLLEMESRKNVVNDVFNTASQQDLIPTRSISSGRCSEESVDLLKDTLATLGEYETIAPLSEEDPTTDAMTKAMDGIRQKESSKDWSAALQDYERAHHLVSDARHGEALMQGTLNCLLELGQFESVLRQVKGSSRTHGSEQHDPVDLVPFAVEASWRLGRWDLLSDLIPADDEKKTVKQINNFQIEMGEAVLAIHQKNARPALDAIDRAREAVMECLSTAARENYLRSYPHLVKLHSLREMEDAVPIICAGTAESDLGTYVNDGGGFWERRLASADPSYTMNLVHPRLALARLARNAGLEASLFLTVGTKARKDRQYSIAASALAQAEDSFNLVKDDFSFDEQRCELIIQLAKLKHEMGEISPSLRLLGMDDIESIPELEDDHSRNNRISRLVSSMLHRQENGMSSDRAIDVFSKCALLSTKWMIEGGVKDCGNIIRRFETIHTIAPKWEKGHFQFAKYIEAVMNARIESLQRRLKMPQGNAKEAIDWRQFCLSQDSPCQKYLNLAVKHYVEALSLDLKHLYQALPRFLSLWFEFTKLCGIVASEDAASQDAAMRLTQNLKKRQSSLTRHMSEKCSSIPALAFYSALPQLISRTTDPNSDLSKIIMSILSRVLSKFPGQAMWHLAWLRQSNDPGRKQIGNRIFKTAEQVLGKESRSERQFKLLVASKGLLDFLHDLAQYKSPEGKKSLNIRSWKGEVPLSEFIPPIQAALSPGYGLLEAGRSQDPFPRQVPRIKEFVRSVGIMASKARPKKLKAVAVIIQSNPRVKQSQSDEVGEFHFLIKQEAKGDLRKDARVQDLNNVINRLFSSSKKKGISAQHRRMRLRTFAVTCLSEETGILEWVPKTSSLRSLVTDAYNPQASPFSSKRRGRRVANAGDSMLRANFQKCQDMFFVSGDLTKAAALFDDLLLKANPPLLFWWFVQNYHDPHRWYEARKHFTLSAAVWSAVGHVIGLGDRHSENILVDTTCGEMVHVDFDCIFDKALNLPKPEVVPFRLTANMIDAFGPVGVDGIYRASLKDAMGILRSNRDTLLSVLEPFINDPIIDWKRSRAQQKSTSRQERQSLEAQRSIKSIEDRLKGVYNLKNPNLKKVRRTDVRSSDIEVMSQTLPLSVEGQVHKLISEATSTQNLLQLYVGWMPWV